MPMLVWPYKAPTDTENYTIDWGRWLDGDTIYSSSWTLPSGISTTENTYTSTQTVIWLTGGTAHTNYDIVNEIVTVGGLTATVRIQVI